MTRAIRREMFEIIRNQGDGHQYAELKASIFPTKFYKYFRPNQNSIDSFDGNYIWHSSPAGYNDPYDSQVGWIGDLNLANSDFLRVFNGNINNNVKICCLTEKNDSTLMWGHYAESHTGFCLEYDFSNPDLEAELVQFYPVYYSTDVLDVQDCLRRKLHPYNILLLAAMLKHSDWEYEQEWRFVATGTFTESKVQVPSPTAIYFGAKSDPRNTYIEQAFEIAKARNIPTYLMTARPDKFEFVAEPCHISPPTSP